MDANHLALADADHDLAGDAIGTPVLDQQPPRGFARPELGQIFQRKQPPVLGDPKHGGSLRGLRNDVKRHPVTRVERGSGRPRQLDRAVRGKQQAGRSGNVADRGAVALHADIDERRGVRDPDANPDEECLAFGWHPAHLPP